MKPIPPRIGQVRTTISRVKSGLSLLWPKYNLVLSDSNKFLLAGKKKSGSATSKYVISADSNAMEKSSHGYLGKVTMLIACLRSITNYLQKIRTIVCHNHFYV